MFRSPLSRFALALALGTIVAGPTAAKTPDPVTTAKASSGDDVLRPISKKKVDIVFALDTTGSMGGLLEGAKQKIWFIANEVLKAKQRPDLRVGLVAYRDKGDAYVTQALPLTSDLDKVYTTLMGYAAGGGGDGPEHVNAALDHAVHHMEWSQGRDTLRMIFLVGDAPPHMDYGDDVKHTTSSKDAVKAGIVINTIQCGSYAEATEPFKQIAYNSEGRYAAIAQDGGVVARATPFDKEVGRLAARLDATRLSYGSKRERAARSKTWGEASSMAAGAAPSVAADRAVAKSKKVASREHDLVTFAEEASLDDALESVEQDALPDALAGKSKEEQKKILADKQAERAKIQAEIAEVNTKREAWLAAEREKDGPPKGFDAEVVEMVRVAGKKAGIDY
jgi:Mg-chelatase subunit ChlD